MPSSVGYLGQCGRSSAKTIEISDRLADVGRRRPWRRNPLAGVGGHPRTKELGMDERPHAVTVTGEPVRFSRRALIHRAIGIGAGISVLPALAACGGGSKSSASTSSGQTTAKAGGSLNILTWETY